MHCKSYTNYLYVKCGIWWTVALAKCIWHSRYCCPSVLPGGNSVPFDVDFSDDDGSLHEIEVTAGIPGTSQSLSATVRFQQTQSTRMWFSYNIHLLWMYTFYTISKYACIIIVHKHMSLVTEFVYLWSIWATQCYDCIPWQWSSS